MDAKTLEKVLHLKELPTLRPAKTVGWGYKMWGQYPALHDDRHRRRVVHGVSYQVETKAHIKLLEAFVGGGFEVAGCMIELESGTEVLGSTFAWEADQEELKDGEFDLKAFQLQCADRC